MSRPTACLEDARWLVGRWTGRALGGRVEEVWGPPQAGTMAGTFRLDGEEGPRFYELMLLIEEGGSLVLRLKHFGADLKGWEERDACVEFPLVALGPGELRFTGLTIRRESVDALTLHLAMRDGEGGLREERFDYRRATLEPAPG
jgi:hypothetical protein